MKLALSLLLVLVSVLFPSDAIVFSVFAGFQEQDLAFCVRQTADGGDTVAGQTDSYGAGHYDVWLVKLDEEGNGPAPLGPEAVGPIRPGSRCFRGRIPAR
jgi:hypothetical protein